MVREIGAVFHLGGGKKALGQPVGGLQALQKACAELRVGLAAEGGDAGDTLGGCWHGVGLLIAHHLQAMLDLAVGQVKLGQLIGHRLGHPIFGGQRLQAAQRGAVAQAGVAAPGNQLAGLGEKLDLTDTALPELHVMPLDRQPSIQAAVFADAQAHVMGVLDGCKIQVLAPDKGGERCEEALPGGQIAAARARFDIGGALPSAALGLVIAVGGGHRQADRGDRGIRAQPQVGAEHIAARHRVAEQRGHLAGDADKSSAGLLPVCTIAVLVKKADQIDVRGVVQLACPHLAHGQREHATRSLGILRRGTGQLAAPDFLGHQSL